MKRLTKDFKIIRFYQKQFELKNGLNIKKQVFYNNQVSLDQIPATSGIYYFYDFNNCLCYIGKAKALLYRIRQHRHLNDLYREGLFLISMTKLVPNYKENDEFSFSIADYTIRCFETVNPLVIDYIFDRINRIEIEEIPYNIIGLREKSMINELKPRFNSQTCCDEYYQILNH